MTGVQWDAFLPRSLCVNIDTNPNPNSIITRYESPDRGTMTDAQWDALFAFVKGGGGFFALHTASACWDHKVKLSSSSTSMLLDHRRHCMRMFGSH